MSGPSLPAVDERSKRNAQDIRVLQGKSTKHGEDQARMDERLGNLEKGQEEAKTERTRQGGVLDKIAAKLDVEEVPHDHNHGGGGPPSTATQPAVATAEPSPTSWLKLAGYGGAGLLVLVGVLSEVSGLTSFLS